MEENNLNENIYYDDISQLFEDFDYRVLKKEDAILFIEDFFLRNNKLSLREVIKLGKVVVLVSAIKFNNLEKYIIFENYQLFIYNHHSENIHEIYDNIFSKWDHHLNYDKIVEIILYSSQINLNLFLISLDYLKKYVIDIDEDTLVLICEFIKIQDKLENYQEIILNLRDGFYKEQEFQSKYFLLSLYFFSLYYHDYFNIEFELIKKDILLIEVYNGISFWNLFYKVIRYCINCKNQKLIEFLFSRFPFYLNKEIFYKMNIDTEQLLEPITTILLISNSKENLDFIYENYISKFFFNYEVILDEIWFYKRNDPILFLKQPKELSHIFMDDYNEIKEKNPEFIYKNELGLFFKLVSILKKNKNYINYKKLLNTMEYEISKLEVDFSDSSFDNILRIWVIYISSTLGEYELARESIFNFLTNLKYDDIDSPQEGMFLIFLTRFFSYLKDKETLISLFNFLISRILNLNEVRIKLVNYLVLISILNNLEDGYKIKFETFFRKDSIPAEIIDELKEYYKNLIGRELE